MQCKNNHPKYFTVSVSSYKGRVKYTLCINKFDLSFFVILHGNFNISLEVSAHIFLLLQSFQFVSLGLHQIYY